MQEDGSCCVGNRYSPSLQEPEGNDREIAVGVAFIRLPHFLMEPQNCRQSAKRDIPHSMKICVTGARGRLGAPIVLALQKAGHKVVPLSRNTDACFSCLSTLPQHIQQGVDAVVHLAWSSVPASAEKHHGAEWREDLPLISSILEECSRSAATAGRQPLFVFFSSCSVYGELPAGLDQPFCEQDPPNPLGWYASAKAAAENLVSLFSRNGCKTLVLRASNPFGFAQGPQKLQGIIPAALHAAQTRQELPIWGDGSAIKDFLDIRDLCIAVTRAVEKQLTGTFNVCSGTSHAISDAVKIVEKATGCRIRLRHIAAQNWDVKSSFYSNQLFASTAAWTPRYSLEEGISELVRASGNLDPT